MLVFLDLETTGLDPTKDKILEVAVIVTDDALAELGHFHQVTDEASRMCLDDLHPVVQRMHCDNGLWMESAMVVDARRAREILRRGTDDPDEPEDVHFVAHSRALANVDTALQEFLMRKVTGKDVGDLPDDEEWAKARKPELAGFSVHFDRRFLDGHMPKTAACLHGHHIMDVSSITEMVRRSWPDVHESRPRGERKHRATDDVLESLYVARHYARVLGPRRLPDATDS